MKQAYFAGGCFWCITPNFKEYDGVSAVTSGYCGGSAEDAVYAKVKSQTTAHRETIRVDYDEDQVAFDTLLDIFLCGVDPFDDGGQFIDRGFSYTLAVYYTDEAQRITAKAHIDALKESSGKDVYIALEPFSAFYPAEEEHQDYYLKNPEAFERELIESGRKTAE